MKAAIQNLVKHTIRTQQINLSTEHFHLIKLDKKVNGQNKNKIIKYHTYLAGP